MDYYRPPARPRTALGQFLGRTPPGVRALLVGCVAVHVLQWGVFFLSPPDYDLLLKVFGLTWDLFRRGFIFQIATYMFLHGDLWHLGFNMFSLWMFGCELERFWGTRRLLKYYAVCGGGAALCTLAVAPFSPASAGVSTIGASGAILGLVLAYGVLFPDRTILLYFFIPMRARTFVIVIGAMQLLFYPRYVASGIAVVAHLGGMLFGLLYLKRSWRIGNLFAEIRWRIRRRRFRVLERKRHNGETLH